ncbi:MAG: FMN-binding protein [Gemmatimonadaceae bacterium]
MSAKNRKTGNLVALGSAAVVAVYGAGFMRTAEAAQRFAEQSDERRVVVDEVAPGVTVPGSANAPASANGVANVVAQTATNSTADANASAKTPAVSKSSVAATTTVKKVDATTAKVAEQTPPDSRSGSASVPMPPEVTTVMSASGVAVTAPQPTTPVEARVPVAEKPAPTANSVTATAVAPTPTVVAPPVATPTVATSMVATPTAAPAQNTKATTAAEPAPAPTVTAPSTTVAAAGAAKYKDGSYTGYGTSRHGDVEVYLETTDGKITYVKISQCLTQYSCSWIEDLPRQVLARQSTKVDGISGATQSANAFYYALVAALAKAK